MNNQDNHNLQKIFRQGSTTYFFSSIFFPREIRKKIFELYAYVRIADNFVDTIPQNKTDFYNWKAETREALKIGTSKNFVIDKFVKLSNEYFEDAWVLSFLDAMEADLYTSNYDTFEELENYMHGSAEVIGLMMASLMHLPKESYPYAKALGKGMQFVNFIRDINEDLELKRVYLPDEDLKIFNIKDLNIYRNPSNVSNQEDKNFRNLINFEIERFFKIITEGEKGYKYIPRNYLIPIQTATNMYKWTAENIQKNPYVIFSKKVKPSKLKIVSSVISSYLM